MCLYGNVHNLWAYTLAAPLPPFPACLPGKMALAYKHSGSAGDTGVHCAFVRGPFQQH